MEKYIILYNKKNTQGKHKWVTVNKYIKKYNIKLIELKDYFIGTKKEKIAKLYDLANNAVDADLNYAGMKQLLNLRIKDIPPEEYIVEHPNDCLKSFIMIVTDHLGTILEVIPNSPDKTSDFASIGRYFMDFE